MMWEGVMAGLAVAAVNGALALAAVRWGWTRACRFL